MQVIEITSLNGHSPYDISICDITLTYCYVVATGVVSVPPTLQLTIPTQLEGASQVLVVVTDSIGCEEFLLESCPLPPTPTPTTTPTPTPTMVIVCNCISFENTTSGTLNFSLTQCNGNILNGMVQSGTTLYYCGRLPSADVGVNIEINEICIDNTCAPIPTATPTATPIPTLAPIVGYFQDSCDPLNTFIVYNIPTSYSPLSGVYYVQSSGYVGCVTSISPITSTNQYSYILLNSQPDINTCQILNPCPPPSFISSWVTTTPSESITLPYEVSGTYSGTIDWGDGNIVVNSYSNRVHTYNDADNYIITITGVLVGWSFGVFMSPTSINKDNIFEVLQWGCLKLGNNGYNFYQCSNLTLPSVGDVINLTGVSNLEGTFASCTSLTTISFVNTWDVSSITNMLGTFDGTLFNDDISLWDVSNVTNMTGMFSSTPFNQPIGGWDVSSVVNMSSMFANSQFNQDISTWNVSNVTNMAQMFDVSVFNQPIGGWDVSNVNTMQGMFATSQFNQDIGSWDVSMVTDFISFMAGKTPITLSTTNLDAIYNGWSSLASLQSGNSISFGGAKYTLGGQSGKNILTGTYGWTIVDGGI